MQLPSVNPGVFSRRFVSRACVALLLVLAVSPAPARSRTAPRRVSSAVDSEYILALGTANRFLHAWQTHDQETALLLLSDAAKRQTSSDNLDTFFSAPQTAYEIAHGRKLGGSRYCFSVVLFDGMEHHRPRTQHSELVVSKTGKDDWVVDKLPQP